MANASVKTTPDAKGTLIRQTTDFVCGMSWETLLSRPSHRHCRHRCERPLRMDAPSTGWVTALAGLLARGSLPCRSGLPSFPVAVLDLRLAAHSCGGSHGFLENSNARICRVRVPSFVPGITRGTSTVKCSLEHAGKSSHAPGALPHGPVSRSCYCYVSGTLRQSRIVFFLSAGFALF
jgi:hypothetical protein